MLPCARCNSTKPCSCWYFDEVDVAMNSTEYTGEYDYPPDMFY